ncbi:MAG: ribosome hibernation-promoting factor, HPF/YfiA family [Actinomycetota bacterium]
MQIIVKGHHAHLTNGLKERATQKVEKVTRLFPRILSAEIEFTENGGARATAAKHRVEVILTAKQHTLRATGRGPDPLSAMDAVVAKLEAQVRRLKGKVTRKGRAAGPGAPSIRTLS